MAMISYINYNHPCVPSQVETSITSRVPSHVTRASQDASTDAAIPDDPAAFEGQLEATKLFSSSGDDADADDYSVTGISARAGFASSDMATSGNHITHGLPPAILTAR